MALTRKLLKSMGIEDEKIDQIIDAHTETVDALKDERDKYKADAEKLPALQKKLDEATETAQKAGEKSPWKVKYDALKEEFDSFKAEQTKAATAAKVREAYTALLKSAGVAEKRIAAILKVTDLDSVELDEDGKIPNAKDLTKAIKTEWADFITSTQSKGAGGETPPANNPSGVKSRADIYKKDDHGRFVLDAAQRQAALVELNANEQKG